MTTITKTSDRAMDHVEDAASHARSTLLELSTQVGKVISGALTAEGRGVDALLDRLGLQRRESAFKPAVWFAAGAVAAGMAVLLMSPTSGKELRRRIASFLGNETETNAARSDALPRVEQVAKSEASTAKNGARHETG
jgi:hypothetical protein